MIDIICSVLTTLAVAGGSVASGDPQLATNAQLATAAPVNHAPTAGADRYTMREDSPAASLDVLADDFDIDAGDTLLITAVTQPDGGTVTITGGGTGLSLQLDPNDMFGGRH